MSTATLDAPMADEKPKAMSVKMPIDVLESARIVAAFRGTTMTDLMADILRPALAKMEGEEMAQTQPVSQEAKRREVTPFAPSVATFSVHSVASPC